MHYDLRAQPAATVEGPDGRPVADPATEMWFQAVAQGFLDARMHGQGLDVAVRAAVADQAILRGVYLQDPPPLELDPHTPVATFISFDKTMNVGGGRLLDVHMITDVTVRPTHRRRGLLRQMMTADLTEARERGLSMAALTVSEGSIYGRFGYGPATWLRHIKIDTSRRFALREEASGRVETIDPHRNADLFPAVFERFHARERGSVARPSWYREVVAGLHDPKTNEVDRHRRAAVHYDADGQVDGYVTYRAEPGRGGSHRLEVGDLVTASNEAYLGLWQFLASVDLVEEVTFSRAPMEDPLEFALADPRLYSVTKLEDVIWLRLLDTEAALRQREWSRDGSVVIEVVDDMDLAGGRFRVEVSGGRAEVSRTEAEPEVVLDVATLGSLYLGGVTARTLRRAGRLRGEPAALDRFAQLMELPTRPYGVTRY